MFASDRQFVFSIGEIYSSKVSRGLLAATNLISGFETLTLENFENQSDKVSRVRILGFPLFWPGRSCVT